MKFSVLLSSVFMFFCISNVFADPHVLGSSQTVQDLCRGMGQRGYYKNELKCIKAIDPKDKFDLDAFEICDTAGNRGDHALAIECLLAIKNKSFDPRIKEVAHRLYARSHYEEAYKTLLESSKPH